MAAASWRRSPLHLAFFRLPCRAFEVDSAQRWPHADHERKSLLRPTPDSAAWGSQTRWLQRPEHIHALLPGRIRSRRQPDQRERSDALLAGADLLPAAFAAGGPVAHSAQPSGGIRAGRWL